MQIIESIPYHSLPIHSKLVKDYIYGQEKLNSFYTHRPSLDGLLQAAQQRRFSKFNRSTLVDALQSQYKNLNILGAAKQNLEKLQDENTFTITTGHQLCAYAGPAYFIYKISSVINLAMQLNEKDQTKHFVPVFWMASEDHDFEEISEVNFYGKSWKWVKENDRFGKVPVGLLNPAALSLWAQEMKSYFHDEENASAILAIFERGYKDNLTLAEATRQIVHELFKDTGLLIIDGNDPLLKRLLIPVLTQEVKSKSSFAAVQQATQELEKLGYEAQITPREINLFYFNADDSRQRIECSSVGFILAGSEKSWSESELLKEIALYPEKFSPNVVLRPVYQEFILPNIAYLGGPAEVAYWLQLKGVFEHFDIDFPAVLVRSSVATVQKNVEEKASKYTFSWSSYFNLTLDEILTKFIQEANEGELDFSQEIVFVNKIAELLNEKANQIDKQLTTQVDIEQKSFFDSLKKLESKFNKSLKQKSESDLKNLQRIRNILMPRNRFQERVINFIDLFGFEPDAIPEIIVLTNPLDFELKLLKN